MPPPEKDKQNIKDSLLRQGVSMEEMEKVYRALRDRGYGEEEARRRSRADLERVRAQKELEERRKAAPARAAAVTPHAADAEPEMDVAPVARAGPEPERGRRAIDWLPEVPPWLRRRINRYAYKNGYLITRLPQRFDDFMSLFDPTRADYASRALVRLLAWQQGYEGRNPYRLSFIDALDALRDSARKLLGYDLSAPGSPANTGEVLRSLRVRQPFAIEFFGVFTQQHEMLRKGLEYLAPSVRGGARVRVAELARVVKDGCRLIVITEAVEPDRLETLFDVMREVNLAHRPAKAVSEVAEAEALFRAGFQSLHRYGHELYPALLKMIARFYEEEDGSSEKRVAVLEFLGIREEEILTWESFQRRARELREKELAERHARELERLEQEKAERLSVRFEGILTTLSSLFPGSGIEHVEQGEFVLPYFVNRIFSRTPIFQARQADLEQLSGADTMGLVIVLHAILDDLLSALEPYAVERLVGIEGIATAFTALRDSWQRAYHGLFEPYLDAVREFARETEGDPRYAKLFRESARARGIEEGINKLRNRAIRNFGHILTDRERSDGSRLFELAARLNELLEKAGTVVNQATLRAEDPVRRRTAEDIAGLGIVDFVAASRTSSVEYCPVTRQIRRWIEARFREPVEGIPGKAQVAFMDVFRGLAELYDYLLNDPKSFVAHCDHRLLIAAAEEREAWDRERLSRGRDSLPSLEASLREEFPGQYMDSLTGLRNKDYFLSELPRQIEKLRARSQPLSFVLIDIDHFKWVNDELGHPRGDEVLKATAGMILDNVREGDLAVRYGGEEILVIVPADLHTGIILAERLRFTQESRVLGGEAMRDVRTVGAAGGQPCGTLSIGVADVTDVAGLETAVQRVDDALYAAKQTRNAVVFVDPGKLAPLEGVAFSTYAEYRLRTGVTPT